MPSDTDSSFVLMQVCVISALHEEILKGKEYDEIKIA